MPEPFDFQKFFEGQWRYKRYTSLHEATMYGEVCFTRMEDKKLSMCDEGSYTLKNKKFDYYQKHIWAFQEGCLVIYKADETLLHNFVLPSAPLFPLQLYHTHQCLKDLYKVCFSLCSVSKWETHYDVLGPKKNYTLNTVYMRKGTDF